MPDKTFPPPDAPGHRQRGQRHLAALRARAHALSGMLRLANILARESRRIDLAGLEEQVGHLCAATLDLEPDEGRTLRADLIALHAATETLRETLRAHPPTD